MRFKTVLIFLLFLPLIVTALDLEEIYRNAQSNDREIKRLSALLEGQRITAQLTKAKEGILLNVSGSNSSAISYSYTYEDYGSTESGTQSITGGFSLSASLPKELGTSISVQLPINV